MRRRAFVILSLLLAINGCGRGAEPEAPVGGNLALWNGKPEGRIWTEAALVALEGHGAVLPAMVPADVARYCPGYEDAGPAARKGFWVTFLSALAKHESTWRADASGGGGRWHGLLQIAPATARGYGCKAQTAGALKEGGRNLSCALRIMAVTVPRDGVISEGMRGVAADWGPFHQAGKRADIQAVTRAYPGCRS